VDEAAKTVTIKTKTREGAKPVAVAVTDKTTFRRYAPGSVHWDDAKPSTLAEIKPGDQIRVLGDKNEDGSKITAEEVVSGSFLTIAGTVISVDAPAGEIRLNDITIKKPVVVKVNAEHTTLRKLPPFAAYMLARQLNPTYKAAENGANGTRSGGGSAVAAGPERRPGAASGTGPAAGGPGSFRGPQGGPGGGGFPGGSNGRMDIGQMLERMPAFTLAELKPGDALIVSTSEPADRTNLTAIAVLSGVEPILVAAPRTFGEASGIANWNLEMQTPGQ
jgi:hypothetical protein